MARPTDFTPAAAEEICERIAAGESVRAITADDHMPAERTVYRWLAARAEFCQQYARAREAQADCFAEELLELSETADTYTDKEGNARVDQGDVQLRKLRSDNLKWIAAKLAPRKYGDRLELSVGNRHEDTLDLLNDPPGVAEPPTTEG